MVVLGLNWQKCPALYQQYITHIYLAMHSQQRHWPSSWIFLRVDNLLFSRISNLKFRSSSNPVFVLWGAWRGGTEGVLVHNPSTHLPLRFLWPSCWQYLTCPPVLAGPCCSGEQLCGDVAPASAAQHFDKSTHPSESSVTGGTARAGVLLWSLHLERNA